MAATTRIPAEIKKLRLSELYGALPPTRGFPGTGVVREEVGRALGRELENQTKRGGFILKPAP
jgi:hypothetical protein